MPAIAKVDRSMRSDGFSQYEVEKEENILIDIKSMFGLKSHAYKFETFSSSVITIKDFHSCLFIHQTLALRTFNRAASYFDIDFVRVKPFLERLKSYSKEMGGTGVELIYSGCREGSCCFSLVVTSEDPVNTLYIYLPETSEESIVEYPQYQNSAVDGKLLICDSIRVLYHPNNNVILNLFSELKELTKFDEKTIATYIEMITTTPNGLALQKIKFEHDFSDDLDLHYGDGFTTFHKKLLERIDSRDKGLVMFHGPPGNGKTHYIRRLLPELSAMGKKIVLIPKHVLSSLESPGFNQFMIQNFSGQKVVFIMEDAESIVSSREEHGQRSEVVSTLLNITDGILNDIFNIQAILTFNIELKKIDDALLRKGRLIAKYQFDPRTKEEAIKLAKHLKIQLMEDKDTYSLAEIYAYRENEEDDLLINQHLKKDSEKMKAVGF